MQNHSDSFGREKKLLCDLCLSGLMAALSFVFCRFLGFPQTGVWRIDPGFLPIVVVAFLSGPVWAGLSYGVADLIGAAIFTGVNPFIMMEKIAIGVLFGVSYYRRERLGLPCILLSQAVVAVFCDFAAMVLIFHFAYGTPWSTALWMRGINAGANFAMRSLLVFLCDLRLFAVLKRRGGVYFGSI